MSLGADEQVRFVDPWTLALPEGGGAVLAAAGAGGKSALLHRLHRHYRGEGLTVLWTQTVAHPAPEGLPARPSGKAERADLRRAGALFVHGPGGDPGRPGPVEPEEVGALRERLRPDVVLVEAQAPCETPLRRDGEAPRWPSPTHVAFLVAGLDALGRPRGPSAVAGEEAPARASGAEPPRVGAEAVEEHCRRLLETVPAGALPLPTLASLARFGDLDAMFRLVATLWEEEGVRAVLLGELVGDPRRDEADRLAFAGSGEDPPHLAGERIYCIYPSRLDD